ncbi:transcription factor Cmr1 [Macrophomina phaseolina MS6]|uniref:Transcription factor Cmr1 n=1 Tax=Macrophomina phaseolina (strain MS6) TaxID=1126212 RepID=K2SAQ1_MACPH|nr:transcription factor Cmr1 [Macrophomina phaseolina MS6]
MLPAEQRLLALIESGGPHDKDELLALFDQLKPISFETLKGEWTGGWFETGHPAGRWMKEIRWVGAAFRSPHDIDPIIARGDDGKKKVLDEWGHAKLFEAKFRGLVSAVVVYDKHPIVDYFRSVNDDFVMGLMERTEWRDSGLSFFYLLREKV